MKQQIRQKKKNKKKNERKTQTIAASPKKTKGRIFKLL